jgi:Tfp pilus assembly protein PilF
MNGEGELPAPKPGWFQSLNLWLAVLLFVVTVVVFYRATGGSFLVYDDSTFVTRNLHVNTGLTWDNVEHAFFGLDAVDWEPLATVSHIIDCQLFGLKPWGHHLVNILIHALNTAGLFLLMRKLTGAVGCSFVVAALFGLHPLRVESVAWVAERKDVLCMTFWLLATWAYARYVEEGRTPVARRYYRLSMVLCALGLLAKPMMVTFPFFLLLLDYWPLKRISEGSVWGRQLWPVIFDKIPFLMLAVAESVVTYALQKQYGAVETALPASACAENALMSYVRYLGKFLWPSDMAVLYPRYDHWTAIQLALAGALMLGITAGAILFRKRAPWLMVGWFWYLGTLIPVIGLVQAGEQSMADRYTYFPMIGITIALVWAGCELTRRWRPILWVLPLLVLLCGYGVLTWRQLGYWQDSHALFEHTVQVTRGNYVADAILADLYHSHGEPEKARALLNDALQANPGFPPAVQLLRAWQFEQDMAAGRQMLHQNFFEMALPAFQEAKSLDPGNAEVHYSLGIIHQAEENYSDAEADYRVALYFKPDSYQARRHLAATLIKDGKVDDAVGEFQTAERQHPDSFDVHNDLASVLAMAGRKKDAVAELKAALQLRPGDPSVTSHLTELEASDGQ